METTSPAAFTGQDAPDNQPMNPVGKQLLGLLSALNSQNQMASEMVTALEGPHPEAGDKAEEMPGHIHGILGVIQRESNILAERLRTLQQHLVG